MASDSCPICGTPLAGPPGLLLSAPQPTYECRRCGPVMLLSHANEQFRELREDRKFDPEVDKAKADAFSHFVRRSWNGNRGTHFGMRADQIETHLRNSELPAPAEQADNLVVWLGGELTKRSDPSGSVLVATDILASIIGARGTNAAVSYIVQQSDDRGRGWLYRANVGGQGVSLQLTLNGWQRFHDLRRAKTESFRAFMAMQFDDASLIAFRECFQPAAKDAGFDLRLVTDGQGAGLIDHHIQVAIRASRFVVADLTAGNRGAYWEAGFAEGIGHPVIYTCREDAFRSPSKDTRPHFDTEHHNTILWAPENYAQARQRLADVIRSTFPSEATMVDT